MQRFLWKHSQWHICISDIANYFSMANQLICLKCSKEIPLNSLGFVMTVAI